MRKLFKYLVILLSVLLVNRGIAQNDSKSACRVEDGRIVFTIDLRWDNYKQSDFMKQFDLDSIVIAKVFEGKATFAIKEDLWSVKKVSTNIVELSKPLDSKEFSYVTKNNVLLSDEEVKIPTYSGAVFADYGVNKLALRSAFKYADGIATFYFPTKKSIQKVYLSGSFNDWSTMQTPMQKTDSGWVARIKLQPGKYYYKYIIDGRWIDDPNNNAKERDGNWGLNSIVYCYNYQFKLTGRTYAQRVIVAGSFNHWDTGELKMIKTIDGWILPIFLSEGTHAYKFIIDGTWITDPANKITRNDGRGNINSFIGIGEEHLFKLKGFTSASRVFLTGDFNAWNEGELQMDKVQDGWQLVYAFGAGNYGYRFIVDGRWIDDPQNPYKIEIGGFYNSFLSFKANKTFLLKKYLDAKKVIVTGSFNGWSRTNYQMVKKDGRWILPIYLKPGKYTYKFIVDDIDWIVDPDNKLWEQNEFGTGNSVLWIEQ